MTETIAVLPIDNASTEITRFNALKHGILSRYTVLPWEDADEYWALVAALAAEHSPRGDERKATMTAARTYRGLLVGQGHALTSDNLFELSAWVVICPRCFSKSRAYIRRSRSSPSADTGLASSRILSTLSTDSIAMAPKAKECDRGSED